MLRRRASHISDDCCVDQLFLPARGRSVLSRESHTTNRSFRKLGSTLYTPRYDKSCYKNLLKRDPTFSNSKTTFEAAQTKMVSGNNFAAKESEATR